MVLFLLIPSSHLQITWKKSLHAKVLNVIQPGGSVRDKSQSEAADKHGFDNDLWAFVTSVIKNLQKHQEIGCFRS